MVMKITLMWNIKTEKNKKLKPRPTLYNNITPITMSKGTETSDHRLYKYFIFIFVEIYTGKIC